MQLLDEPGLNSRLNTYEHTLTLSHAHASHQLVHELLHFRLVAVSSESAQGIEDKRAESPVLEKFIHMAKYLIKSGWGGKVSTICQRLGLIINSHRDRVNEIEVLEVKPFLDDRKQGMLGLIYAHITYMVVAVHFLHSPQDPALRILVWEQRDEIHTSFKGRTA